MQFARAVSLLSPRRFPRHARSALRRLRALAGGGGRAPELEQLFGDLAQRLEQMVAGQIDRVAQIQKSETNELRSAINDQFDMLKSWNLDYWKLQELEGLLRYLRRQAYVRAIEEGRLAVPRLETDHPIAVSSNDTKFPRGSRNDNSIALRFNRRLYQFLGGREHVRVLDLGCAGGGFVRSLLDDGHFAVGLDGSDYPYVNQAAEWPTIPFHLFTCDITKPFQLSDRSTGEPLRFDAITAWEVMEHIPEADLPGLFDNLERHLAPGGCLVLSIATFLDWDPQTGCIWHVTVKPRSWWEDRFAQLGFQVVAEHPFGKNDWLRGAGQCRGDWHEDDGMGFHVVLKKKAESQALEPSVPSRHRSVA